MFSFFSFLLYISLCLWRSLNTLFRSFITCACIQRYEAAYDTFMEKIEPISSSVPYQVNPGNHDVSCHSVWNEGYDLLCVLYSFFSSLPFFFLSSLSLSLSLSTNTFLVRLKTRLTASSMSTYVHVCMCAWVRVRYLSVSTAGGG